MAQIHQKLRWGTHRETGPRPVYHTTNNKTMVKTSPIILQTWHYYRVTKNPVATNLRHDEIYALINEHDTQPIYGRYQDHQNNFIRQWLDALGTPHDTYDVDTFSNHKPYTVAWWRPYREQQEAEIRENDSRIRGPNATIFPKNEGWTING